MKWYLYTKRMSGLCVGTEPRKISFAPSSEMLGEDALYSFTTHNIFSIFLMEMEQMMTSSRCTFLLMRDPFCWWQLQIILFKWAGCFCEAGGLEKERSSCLDRRRHPFSEYFAGEAQLSNQIFPVLVSTFIHTQWRHREIWYVMLLTFNSVS